MESPRWSRTAVGVRLQRRPGAPLQRLHCPPPATSTTVTYSAWRCYPNTTWRTRARETCVLLTSSAGSSRTRRPDMSTAACRPRPRALAALLPMNSTLVHGGTSALAHLLKTTPRREGRRVGEARVSAPRRARPRSRATKRAYCRRHRPVAAPDTGWQSPVGRAPSSSRHKVPPSQQNIFLLLRTIPSSVNRVCI